jgi:hypothetical protein
MSRNFSSAIVLATVFSAGILPAQTNSKQSGRDGSAEQARKKQDLVEGAEKLQAEVASLKAELAKSQAEAQRAVAEKALAAATLNALNGKLRLKTEEIDQLNEQIKSSRVQIAEMQTRIVDLTENVAGLAKRLADSYEQVKLLGKELEKSRDTAKPPIPKLEGIVRAVAANGLVEITLGTDDGVTRGMTFEVARDAKYLGRIEIVQTTPDTAVGKVLAEYKKGEIKKDDYVTTRLN